MDGGWKQLGVEADDTLTQTRQARRSRGVTAHSLQYGDTKESKVTEGKEENKGFSVLAAL
jgi:hypothetical protein